MTILHTVNKRSALADCLRLAPTGGAILLIEDGVLAIADSEGRQLLESAAGLHKLYALAPDLAARGLSPRLPPDIEALGYDGFVELCTRHDKVQCWF